MCIYIYIDNGDGQANSRAKGYIIDNVLQRVYLVSSSSNPTYYAIASFDHKFLTPYHTWQTNRSFQQIV